MSVTLSFAVTADGYLDDSSSERLIISTPEDWAEVYALRAASDAIVIGGNTLRCDNPSLRSKAEGGRELVRVVISGRGEISPDLRIFSVGNSRVIIFSNIERPELDGLAEVVVLEHITASVVVSRLEKMGLYNIMVEGGAEILTLFLNERNIVDKIRIARNPAIVVADESAPHFCELKWLGRSSKSQRKLGAMVIEEVEVNRALSADNERFMQLAIEQSRLCDASSTRYSVGAVVVTKSGDIFTGYSGEGETTHHAEQTAIYKALAAGASLEGGAIYSTLEPCSQRASEPKSCSEIIAEHKFAEVYFCLYEPSNFVQCEGAQRMRQKGVRVVVMEQFAGEVIEVNKHILDK